MPASPRAPTIDKRALARIRADVRRLDIIRTNQARLVAQMQELVARYNKSEILASDTQKKVNDALAGIAAKVG